MLDSSDIVTISAAASALGAEIKEAVAADSPSGKRVTRKEAGEIAQKALALVGQILRDLAD